jgi:hypothetical protein
MPSRGIRNNNPGNIRLREGVHWEGQVDASTQTDVSFVQFIAPEYGIRAMAKIFRHYEAMGINTVQACISRWAPPSENNTEAYVNAVAAACHVEPTDVVSFAYIMPDLIAAVIFHENGMQPYTPEQIAEGIKLAEDV